MKKKNKTDDDDLRPEYDFSSMKGGVRGKYYERYRAGANIVLFDPEARMPSLISTAGSWLEHFDRARSASAFENGQSRIAPSSKPTGRA